MAKFVHADVLDGGLLAIQSGATQVRLISAYAAGDSFSTVNTNTLATVTTTSADYTLSSVGNDRRLTTASKSGTASASATGSPDLHIAFVNVAGSKVLWVTDETSNQAITSGNPVTIPAVTYTNAQPT